MKLQRSLPGVRLISPVFALTIPVTVLQQSPHVLAASTISQAQMVQPSFVGTV